ncbi:MAG TPA: hypothetical protein VFI91_10150 [Longimicrobiaceae bacterium]|nr:hypothetical protein [Longimicrobiaceae bacterium]
MDQPDATNDSVGLTGAAEVEALFRRMAIFSAAALASLGSDDADAAAQALRERGRLIQRIDALLPALIEAQGPTRNASGGGRDPMEKAISEVRRAAEAARSADSALISRLQEHRDELARHLDADENRAGGQSGYDPSNSTRPAYIDIVR